MVAESSSKLTVTYVDIVRSVCNPEQTVSLNKPEDKQNVDLRLRLVLVLVLDLISTI